MKACCVSLTEGMQEQVGAGRCPPASGVEEEVGQVGGAGGEVAGADSEAEIDGEEELEL